MASIKGQMRFTRSLRMSIVTGRKVYNGKRKPFTTETQGKNVATDLQG